MKWPRLPINRDINVSSYGVKSTLAQVIKIWFLTRCHWTDQTFTEKSFSRRSYIVQLFIRRYLYLLSADRGFDDDVYFHSESRHRHDDTENNHRSTDRPTHYRTRFSGTHIGRTKDLDRWVKLLYYDMVSAVARVLGFIELLFGDVY